MKVEELIKRLEGYPGSALVSISGMGIKRIDGLYNQDDVPVVVLHGDGKDVSLNLYFETSEERSLGGEEPR